MITKELAVAARQQAEGVQSILEAGENMNQMTQQVANATDEQKRGGDLVVKAVEEIATVARQNLASSEQLTVTTSSLVTEAESLRSMAEHFELTDEWTS